MAPARRAAGAAASLSLSAVKPRNDRHGESEPASEPDGLVRSRRRPASESSSLPRHGHGAHCHGGTECHWPGGRTFRRPRVPSRVTLRGHRAHGALIRSSAESPGGISAGPAASPCFKVSSRRHLPGSRLRRWQRQALRVRLCTPALCRLLQVATCNVQGAAAFMQRALDSESTRSACW